MNTVFTQGVPFLIQAAAIALLAAGLLCLTKGIREKRDPARRRHWLLCGGIALAGWLGVNLVGALEGLL